MPLITMTLAIAPSSYSFMAKTFRPGRTYTLDELAELARRGIENQGLTQQQAADHLNEHYPTARKGSAKFHRAQVGAAIANPERNPRMLLLLIEAFTDYTVRTPPRYLLDRKETKV